jgi:hypothetical protein
MWIPLIRLKLGHFTCCWYSSVLPAIFVLSKCISMLWLHPPISLFVGISGCECQHIICHLLFFPSAYLLKCQPLQRVSTHVFCSVGQLDLVLQPFFCSQGAGGRWHAPAHTSRAKGHCRDRWSSVPLATYQNLQFVRI